MRAEDLDYELPGHAVAQQPVEPRDAARLLVDGGPGRPCLHRHVRDLPELLGPGDLLVVNTSRVLPARLLLRKPTGGRVEVLLLERAAEGHGQVWSALVRPGRRVAPGTRLAGADGEPRVEVGRELGDGQRLVRLLGDDPDATLRTLGEIPLPPYITEPLADPGRYQTVYADQAGSVAAPTAGLHLTDELLAAVEATGATTAGIDLAIGLDTFRPVTHENLDDHAMHSETYRVDSLTWQACARAKRVVAVGTTVVRALESVAATGELAGRTDLLIAPGHRFGVVDALLTNFHLPRTTLLAMIEAFIGPRWRNLYAEALAEGYRFLSFGDAMFLPARTPGAPR